MSSDVLAYLQQPPAPQTLGAAWNVEPSLLVPLGLAVLVFAWGVRKAWGRAGAGRGLTARACVCFLGALTALAAALVSPLDALSGQIFAAHMAQHLILVLIAAPLLVTSDLPLALLWALPQRWAQASGQYWNRLRLSSHAWRAISSPIPAWLFFTIAMWAWHAPALYEAALGDEGVHALEHLTLLASAMLFWRVLLDDAGPKHLRYGVAVPYLFTTALQSGALGALMTFTSRPWYSYYTPLVSAWGLTPLQDQQLAGIIMWVPGGAVFALLTVGYFAAWLQALEQHSSV